jgi:hypothetical protein
MKKQHFQIISSKYYSLIDSIRIKLKYVYFKLLVYVQNKIKSYSIAEEDEICYTAKFVRNFIRKRI